MGAVRRMQLKSAKVAAFPLGPPKSQGGLAVHGPVEGAGGGGTEQGNGGVPEPPEGGLPLLSQPLLGNQEKMLAAFLPPFSLSPFLQPPAKSRGL